MDLAGLVEKRNRKGTRYFENKEGEVVMKVCSKCNITKVLAEYAKQPQGLGGRVSKCKACNAKYRKENKERITEIKAKYYKENKEHIEEKRAKYCEKYKERIAKRAAKYYKENKKQILEYRAKYYKENKEEVLKNSAKYYKENKEQKLEYRAKYYKENKERVAAWGAKYRIGNKERISENKAKWRRENPEKAAMSYHRRRARKAALPDTLTDDVYLDTLAYFGNACALTGETLNLTREHAIPLAVGHGGTIRENMYPMVGRLNFSKGDRNIFEWFEANRQRFALSQERFDKLIDWLASANAMTVEEYRDYVYWCHANPREITA